MFYKNRHKCNYMKFVIIFYSFSGDNQRYMWRHMWVLASMLVSWLFNGMAASGVLLEVNSDLVTYKIWK